MKTKIIEFITVFTFFLAFAMPARAASCEVTTVSIGARSTTSSPVIYSADAKCDTGVKSMRFTVNGNVIYERANTSHIGYWYKPNSSDKLCFEAKGDEDTYSASRCFLGSATTSTAGGAVLGATTDTSSISTTTSRVQNTTCPSTVAPRLANGKSGKTLTNVNVRAAAGIGSLRIGRLASGTTFEVQSDYTCNGGINWWKIKIQEFTGMIAESQFGSYLLSP